ncbi:hypothetical protein DFH28DRAFT_998079 [Melampsora americana]|nr:hypothetical protein DFH28DRAFT_998079 [Melampsora americana]
MIVLDNNTKDPNTPSIKTTEKSTQTTDSSEANLPQSQSTSISKWLKILTIKIQPDESSASLHQRITKTIEELNSEGFDWSQESMLKMLKNVGEVETITAGLEQCDIFDECAIITASVKLSKHLPSYLLFPVKLTMPMHFPPLGYVVMRNQIIVQDLVSLFCIVGPFCLCYCITFHPLVSCLRVSRLFSGLFDLLRVIK